MKDHIDLPLFDEFGRFQPQDNRFAVQPKTRRYFRCDPPEINLRALYERCARGLDLPLTTSFESFETAVQTILDKLKNDPLLSNILKGVFVPYIIAQQEIEDMGTALSARFIPGVQKSFEEKYPNARFKNHNQKDLTERFSIDAKSAHQELVDRLQHQDVIGIYFPCMDGYSLEAARDQMKFLGPNIALAGGIDTSSALMACPDLLIRENGYPPLLWWSALQSTDANENFHFEAYGYDLTFNRRVHLGNADEYWASGLSVLEEK